MFIKHNASCKRSCICWELSALESKLGQFLLLPALKLFRLVLDRFDQQRQTWVHSCPSLLEGCGPLLVPPLLTLTPPLSLDPLLLLTLSLFLLTPPLLLLSSALLLTQDALSGSGVPVGGVGGVQVEQVGGEHGLKARVFDVHLEAEGQTRLQTSAYLSSSSQ